MLLCLALHRLAPRLPALVLAVYLICGVPPAPRSPPTPTPTECARSPRRAQDATCTAASDRTPTKLSSRTPPPSQHLGCPNSLRLLDASSAQEHRRGLFFRLRPACLPPQRRCHVLPLAGAFPENSGRSTAARSPELWRGSPGGPSPPCHFHALSRAPWLTCCLSSREPGPAHPIGGDPAPVGDAARSVARWPFLTQVAGRLWEFSPRSFCSN